MLAVASYDLVVTIGEVVGDDHDGEDDQDVSGRISRVLRLSRLQPLDLPFLTYDLQRRDSIERAVKKSPTKMTLR